MPRPEQNHGKSVLKLLQKDHIPRFYIIQQIMAILGRGIVIFLGSSSLFSIVF